MCTNAFSLSPTVKSNNVSWHLYKACIMPRCMMQCNPWLAALLHSGPSLFPNKTMVPLTDDSALLLCCWSVSCALAGVILSGGIPMARCSTAHLFYVWFDDWHKSWWEMTGDGLSCLKGVNFSQTMSWFWVEISIRREMIFYSHMNTGTPWPPF